MLVPPPPTSPVRGRQPCGPLERRRRGPRCSTEASPSQDCVRHCTIRCLRLAVGIPRVFRETNDAACTDYSARQSCIRARQLIVGCYLIRGHVVRILHPGRETPIAVCMSATSYCVLKRLRNVGEDGTFALVGEYCVDISRPFLDSSKQISFGPIAARLELALSSRVFPPLGLPDTTTLHMLPGARVSFLGLKGNKMTALH